MGRRGNLALFCVCILALGFAKRKSPAPKSVQDLLFGTKGYLLLSIAITAEGQLAFHFEPLILQQSQCQEPSPPR